MSKVTVGLTHPDAGLMGWVGVRGRTGGRTCIMRGVLCIGMFGRLKRRHSMIGRFWKQLPEKGSVISGVLFELCNSHVIVVREQLLARRITDVRTSVSSASPG